MYMHRPERKLQNTFKNLCIVVAVASVLSLGCFLHVFHKEKMKPKWGFGYLRRLLTNSCDSSLEITYHHLSDACAKPHAAYSSLPPITNI